MPPWGPLPVEHHTNESFVLVSFLRCTTWATVGGWCTGPSPQVGATLPWVVCVCHHVARATLQHPAPGVWPVPVTESLPNLLWVGCQVACLGQAPIALVWLHCGAGWGAPLVAHGAAATKEPNGAHSGSFCFDNSNVAMLPLRAWCTRPGGRLLCWQGHPRARQGTQLGYNITCPILLLLIGAPWAKGAHGYGRGALLEARGRAGVGGSTRGCPQMFAHDFELLFLHFRVSTT